MGEREDQLAEDLKENKDVIKAIHHQHEKAHDAVTDKHHENREIRDKVAKDLDDAAKRMKDE